MTKRTFFRLTIFFMIIAAFSGISFAAENEGSVSDNTTKKLVKIEGKYMDETAYVKVRITDPDSIEVTDDDYYKFLTELEIGDGLKIPLEDEGDLSRMRAIATSEAIRNNEKAVQLKKAQRIEKETVKKAKAEARAKAKKQYEKVWNQKYEIMGLPAATNGSTKTYMDYRTVTATGSPQYALLNNTKKAYTKDGFRMYDGYYCVALGSYYGTTIGTKYYIELSNGRTLRCILGDQKSDRHTDENHQYAVNNKDILEFIVDDIALPGGDVSAVPGFEGSIVSIKKIIESDEDIYKEIYGDGYVYVPPAKTEEKDGNDKATQSQPVSKPKKKKNPVKKKKSAPVKKVKEQQTQSHPESESVPEQETAPVNDTEKQQNETESPPADDSVPAE